MVFTISKRFSVCRVSVQIKEHIRDNKADLIDISKKLFLIHISEIQRIFWRNWPVLRRRAIIWTAGAGLRSVSVSIAAGSVHRQAPPFPQNGRQSSGNTVPRERAVAGS